MTTATKYRITKLGTDEATAILARNRVGRIAYILRDHADIEPVGYVFADGVINLRTSPGAKLDALKHQPSVAFEVDEIAGPFDWRSVVVHGTVYLPDPGGSEVDRQAHAEALRRLHGAYGGALTEDDPAAFRTVVLRLHVVRIEGRTAIPA
jgi:nitroimidazol reductase NimA-like FMN-containing flavoprotein (pyridoxamine 5'-phosphate oxidase superfamily)